MEKTKRGLYVNEWWPELYRDRFECLNDEDSEIKIVQILEKGDPSFFGDLYKIRVRKGKHVWDISIPEEAIFFLEGKCCLGAIRGEAHLKKENIIRRLYLTENGLSYEDYEITPLFSKKLGSKLRLLVDDKGIIHLVQNTLVNTGRYGMVGVNFFGKTPSEGNPYSFKSILAFTRSYSFKDVEIEKVNWWEKIADNTYSVTGLISFFNERKQNHVCYYGTAYVQVK